MDKKLQKKREWFELTNNKRRNWRLYLSILLIFKKYFLNLFLERGEGKERNINVWLPLLHPLLETWPTTQACALIRNRTSDPLVHRLALNPLSHTSQDDSPYFKLLNCSIHVYYEISE